MQDLRVVLLAARADAHLASGLRQQKRSAARGQLVARETRLGLLCGVELERKAGLGSSRFQRVWPVAFDAALCAGSGAISLQ
jgi:hypothetical protein